MKSNKERIEESIQPILDQYGMTKEKLFGSWENLSVKEKIKASNCLKQINRLTVLSRLYLDQMMGVETAEKRLNYYYYGTTN